MPMAPSSRPPHQHSAATKPALRGPTRSSQPPHRAADDAEHDEEQSEHPPEARDLPITCGGEELRPQRHIRAGLRRGQSDRARQRQPEHREAVGHADAQMDAERCRRHQPAIEPGGRNGPLAIKKPCASARNPSSAFYCRHAFLPCSRPSEQPAATILVLSPLRCSCCPCCSAQSPDTRPGSSRASEKLTP